MRENRNVFLVDLMEKIASYGIVSSTPIMSRNKGFPWYLPTACHLMVIQ